MLRAVMKMKKIAAISLALTLLAFPLTGQARAAAKHYRDAEHGFSFSYPETWGLQNTSIDFFMLFVEGVWVVAPPVDGRTAVFCVNVIPVPEGEEVSVDDLFAEFFQVAPDDAEILLYEKTKLKDVPCVAMDCLHLQPVAKLMIRYKMYASVDNERAYILILAAPEEDYGKYEASFEAILDSFKFRSSPETRVRAFAL